MRVYSTHSLITFIIDQREIASSISNTKCSSPEVNYWSAIDLKHSRAKSVFITFSTNTE